jgi:hypothetical protein
LSPWHPCKRSRKRWRRHCSGTTLTQRSGVAWHNSGTATLVSTGRIQLAITGGHVYSEYLADKAVNPRIECQLGASLFSPEDHLIDFDERIDLATFRLPMVPPRCVVHSPATPWPPAVPDAESRIMIGGHLGDFRTESNDAVHGGFVTFYTRVHGSGPSSISFKLGIAHGMAWPEPTKLAPGTSMGGASGGPVFRCDTIPSSRGV